jgi:hypothetical protein
MNSLRLAGLTASFLFSACASTYKGRVIASDGSPVGGARIQALGSWSLLSATPFDWSSGMHLRGSANSLPDGTFLLHASAFRVQELAADGEAGKGMILKPSPSETLTIMIKPEIR